MNRRQPNRPTAEQLEARRAEQAQKATERAEADERYKAELARQAARTPVPMGRRGLERGAWRDFASPQGGKPPMSREQTPQGDVYRDDLGWDDLDKQIDAANTTFNELLDGLKELLEREHVLAAAERERINALARDLPALGTNR